jgi:hypothetical protein
MRAPSFSEIHMPKSSFCPSSVIPSTRYTARFEDALVFSHFAHQAIDRDDGIQRLQGPVLRTLAPHPSRLQSHWRSALAKPLPPTIPAVAPGHGRVENPWACIHRIFSLKPVRLARVLLHEEWVIAALPISWDGEFHRPLLTNAGSYVRNHCADWFSLRFLARAFHNRGALTTPPPDNAQSTPCSGFLSTPSGPKRSSWVGKAEHPCNSSSSNSGRIVVVCFFLVIFFSFYLLHHRLLVLTFYTNYWFFRTFRAQQ